MFKPLNHENAADLQAAVQEILRKGDYRYTGCYAIIKTLGDEVFVVITQSPKEHELGLYSLPQGGFKPGETPAQNATRELREELGIQTKKISAITPNFSSPFSQDYDVARITRELTDKGRAYRGKAYYPSRIIVAPDTILSPNGIEVAAADFYRLSEAMALVSRNPYKGSNYLDILNRLR